MAKYKAGDNVYILECNRIVTPVKILKWIAGMYLIQLPSGGGIQVKEHRLFRTEEEAKAAVPYSEPERRKKTPYDYM